MMPIVGWRPDCVSHDGEEHQRLRAAVNECLARFDRHGVRRHVQRYANQLIDGFVETGGATWCPSSPSTCRCWCSPG
jgi:cytochrome P450